MAGHRLIALARSAAVGYSGKLVDKEKTSGRQRAGLCAELGSLYMQLDMFDAAISELMEALQYYDTNDESASAASVCRNIGDCFVHLQDPDAAIVYHEQFVNLAQACADMVQQQRSWMTLGRTNLFKAESVKQSGLKKKILKSCEMQFQRSLELVQGLGNRVTDQEKVLMTVRATFNIGLTQDLRGDYQSAAESHRKACAMCRGYVDLVDDLYGCQVSLGEVLRKQNQHKEACEAFDLAYKSADKMKDAKLKKDVLMLKAQTLVLLREFWSARRNLKLARRLGETDMEFVSSIVKYYKAVVRLEQCTLAENDMDTMQAYEVLGDIDADHQRYDSALDHYLSMVSDDAVGLMHRVFDPQLDCARRLGLSEPDMARIYESLAVTYEDMSLYDEACAYYRKAAHAYSGDRAKVTEVIQYGACGYYRNVAHAHHSNHTEECKCWMNVANAQSLDAGSYTEICESYAQAYSAASADKLRHLQLKILKSLATTQESYSKHTQKDKTLSKIASLRQRHGVTSDSESEDDMGDHERSDRKESSDASNAYDVEMSDLSDSDVEGVEVYHSKVTRVHKNFTKRNEHGETVLQQAVIKGHLAKVTELIDMGAAVNVRDHSGWTPLHEAAFYGHVDLIRLLLDHGANIADRGGDQCRGITPLHSAAEEGNLSVVELLIDRGADVIAKDDSGNTPLASLEAWRCESDGTLDALTLVECNRMEKKLMHKMTALGYQPKPNHTPPPSMHHKQINRYPETHSDADDDPCPTLAGVTVCPDDQEDIHHDTSLYRTAILSSECQKSASFQYQSAILNCRSSAITKNRSCHPDTSTLSKDTLHGTSRTKHSVGHHAGVSCITHDTDSRSIKRKRVSVKDFCTGDNIRVTSSGKKIKRSENYTGSYDKNIVSMLMVNCDNGDNSTASTNQDVSPVACDSADSVAVTTTASPPPSITTLPTAPSTLPPVLFKVKVKVNDKLLLVPLHAGHEGETIAWLTEEVAVRYATLYGVKPVLQLRTCDGAVIAPTDIIKSVVSPTDHQMEAEVESWVVPPISDRYKQACQKHSTLCYKNITQVLHSSDTTSDVQLSNLGLRLTHLVPVYTALIHHTSLRQLHLKGNRLGDSGVESLCKVLASLINLQVLDLGCCQVTAVGIKYLADVTNVPHSSALKNVTDLLLDHNPLTDASGDSLVNLIKSLPHLQALNLSSVFITNHIFQGNKFSFGDVIKGSSVRALVISHNALGAVGIELLLRSLPVNQIHELDLAYCVDNSTTYIGRLEHLITDYVSQQASCALETLSISGCHLSTNEILDISQLPKLHPKLLSLDLSNNDGVRNKTLEQLLINSKESNLKNIVLTSCCILSPLDCDLLDALTQKLQFSSVPLISFNVSSKGLDKIDLESLQQIWRLKWGDSSSFMYYGDTVVLSVQ